MKKLWLYLDRNKTKLTGLLTSMLGVVQVNAVALQVSMSPVAYAWTMVGVGCFVTFLGFLNTPKKQ